MNNLTIVTKLRFMAALAPAILLLAAAVIVGAFRFFGGLPAELHENEYAAARAAQGMDSALYKMDWGRTQPDASQIVMDQQRGFISEIEIARNHIDSLEPKLRDLQGAVTDLMSLDDAALLAVASAAESQSRTMIAITIVALVAVPWTCFAVIVSLSRNLYKERKEIRRHAEALSEREPSDDIKALDQSLTKLGFAKPNPMLAE